MPAGTVLPLTPPEFPRSAFRLARFAEILAGSADATIAIGCNIDRMKTRQTRAYAAMSGRFRVSRLVARQLKDHGIPELAVLRRAGLWDGWLRQDKILATTEELFGFWRAVEEVSGDPTVSMRLGPNLVGKGHPPRGDKLL